MARKKKKPDEPAEAFPVFEFVKEELFKRSWSLADLAEKSGLELGLLTAFMKGARPLTVHIATELGKAFGVDPILLLDINRSYEARKQRSDNLG